jgi:hypothetical protein
MRSFGKRIHLFVVSFLLSSSVGAVDIEFVFYETDDKALEIGGVLDPNSRLHKELMQAGHYLARRIDAEATIRIGFYADENIGGAAWAAPSEHSPVESGHIFEERSVNVQVPAALAEIRGDLTLDGNCDTHFNMGVEFSKLNFADYVDILGVYLHEFMHGLGVYSTRNSEGAINENGFITHFDTLISRENNEVPDVFVVGGENVKQLYGRQVRLLENFLRGAFSHVGGTSSRQILPWGEVWTKPQHPLGEYSNRDAGASVTTGGSSYLYGPGMTPIDLAILKDLGYPVATAGSHFFYSAPDDFPPSSTNINNVDFLNILTIPMLRLDTQVFRAHMAWDGNLGFRVLGMATDGDHGFLQMTGQAPYVLNSSAAELNLDTGILHIPLLEIYEGNGAVEYSAILKLIDDGIPAKFELRELRQRETSPSTSQVSFRVCEDDRVK